MRPPLACVVSQPLGNNEVSVEACESLALFGRIYVCLVYFLGKAPPRSPRAPGPRQSPELQRSPVSAVDQTSTGRGTQQYSRPERFFFAACLAVDAPADCSWKSLVYRRLSC